MATISHKAIFSIKIAKMTPNVTPHFQGIVFAKQ